VDDRPILITLALLDEHPLNPRAIWREDVIESIAARIRAAGAFDPSHAITVRPVPQTNRYQIISGHHRTRAAKRADLAEIPAWVRKMTDEEALVELIQGNTQSELSSIERGLHALAYIEKGRHGTSVAAYAERVGRKAPTVDKDVRAARVAKACAPELMPQLLSRARHLSEIYALDPECWPAMVGRTVAEEWTAREAHNQVAAILALRQPEEFAYLFPVETMRQRAAADGAYTQAHFSAIVRAIQTARDDIAFLQYKTPEATADLGAWLRDNIGGAAWNTEAIHERALEICDAISRDKLEHERRSRMIAGPALDAVARAAAAMYRRLQSQATPGDADCQVIEEAAATLRAAGYL